MSPREQLVQGRPFTRRNGVDEFYWKGMATKTDPEAQPGDRPRLVMNGRYVGGHIISRPGLKPSVAQVPEQTGLDMTAAGWEPAFMGEHHSYGGVKLWWGAEFAAGTASGGTFGYVDTDSDPEHNELAVHYQSTNTAPCLVYYGGFIYAGATGALRRIYRIQTAPGVLSPVPVRLPADEVVAYFPGYVIQAMHVHEGVLYFVAGDTVGAAGKIYSWDGYQTVLEYTYPVAANLGAAITTFQEKVVVSVNGSANLVIRAAAGTWSTATVAGFAASGYINSMAQLKNKLYIASGGTKIHSYNGTAVALDRTIATGTAPGTCNCLCAFEGRLYYTWSESLGGGAGYPWLGYFDPDTATVAYQWKDDYVGLGLGSATVAVVDAHSVAGQHAAVTPGTVTALAPYRGRLFVAMTKNSADARNDSKIMTHAVAHNPYSGFYACHAWETAANPSGPVYFAKQLAATGSFNERIIQYFEVL